MPISYSKLLKKFQENNITSYTLTKKDKIIGQATWDNIQEGKSINTKTIGELCNYLNCQPGDILEYISDEIDSQFNTDIQYIYLDFPDMSVSAGTGQFLDNNKCDKLKIVSTPVSRSASFVLKISGDSMEPNFSDGDVVLVKKVSVVDIGDVGIFALNGEGYIKQFGGDRLISFNKNYSDIMFTKNDSFYCFGKVIGKTELL